MKLLLAALLALAGFASGCVLTFLAVEWRIGAAEAKTNLYMLGAAEAFKQLDQCERQPRRGTFVK